MASPLRAFYPGRWFTCFPSGRRVPSITSAQANGSTGMTTFLQFNSYGLTGRGVFLGTMTATRLLRRYSRTYRHEGARDWLNKLTAVIGPDRAIESRAELTIADVAESPGSVAKRTAQPGRLTEKSVGISAVFVVNASCGLSFLPLCL